MVRVVTPRDSASWTLLNPASHEHSGYDQDSESAAPHQRAEMETPTPPSSPRSSVRSSTATSVMLTSPSTIRLSHPVILPSMHRMATTLQDGPYCHRGNIPKTITSADEPVSLSRHRQRPIPLAEYRPLSATPQSSRNRPASSNGVPHEYFPWNWFPEQR